MKNHFLKTRVSKDEYIAISGDADKSGLTISEHIRVQLMSKRQAITTETAFNQILTKLSSDTSEPNFAHRMESIFVETVFLVREIALSRDPQALARVNSKLDRLFSAERKKI